MSENVQPQAVVWLEDGTKKRRLTSHRKFRFHEMVAEIGDFVLISNADAADPDTEEGCHIAKIISLYEDSFNERGRFRAKVQWFSRPNSMPKWCLNYMEPFYFQEKEVLEDHRLFQFDVSIETFVKKCSIAFVHTKYTEKNLLNKLGYDYFCRYKVLPVNKRRVHIEPVLGEEKILLRILRNRTIHKASTKTTKAKIFRCTSKVLKTRKRSKMLLINKSIEYDKTNITCSTNKLESSIQIGFSTPSIILNCNENATNDISCTRSGRVIKRPAKYEHEDSPPKKNAKMSILMTEDDGFQPVLRTSPTPRTSTVNPSNKFTPKTSRTTTVKTLRGFTLKTPKSSIYKTSRVFTPKTPRTLNATTPTNSAYKRIIVSQLTPKLASRSPSIDHVDAFVRDKEFLPIRELQMHDILSFVPDKLVNGHNSGNVTSTSGIDRHALEPCSPTSELLSDDSSSDFEQVQQAFDETASRRRSCSPAGKVTPEAIASDVESTDSEETNVCPVVVTRAVGRLTRFVKSFFE